MNGIVGAQRVIDGRSHSADASSPTEHRLTAVPLRPYPAARGDGRIGDGELPAVVGAQQVIGERSHNAGPPLPREHRLTAVPLRPCRIARGAGGARGGWVIRRIAAKMADR
jgi:hypothetical protein